MAQAACPNVELLHRLAPFSSTAQTTLYVRSTAKNVIVTL